MFLRGSHVRNCEASLKAIKEDLHKGMMPALGAGRTCFCWDVCAANINALPTRVRVRVACFFICLFERIDILVIKFMWKAKKKSKKEELNGKSHISVLKTRRDAQRQLHKSQKWNRNTPTLSLTDPFIVTN